MDPFVEESLEKRLKHNGESEGQCVAYHTLHHHSLEVICLFGKKSQQQEGSTHRDFESCHDHQRGRANGLQVREHNWVFVESFGSQSFEAHIMVLSQLALESGPEKHQGGVDPQLVPFDVPG
jgi:hypothetical protein